MKGKEAFVEKDEAFVSVRLFVVIQHAPSCQAITTEGEYT